MKIEYDREACAAYVEIYENAPVESTKEISSSVFVDLDEYGVVVGVELLKPAEPTSLSTILAQAHVHREDVEALGRALGMVPRLSIQQNQLTRACLLYP